MQKQKKKILEYNVIFTAEKEGGFSVYAPDLPGCISQGESYEEAVKNIKEAIGLYLEEVDENLYHMTPQDSRRQFMAPVDIQVHG